MLYLLLGLACIVISLVLVIHLFCQILLIMDGRPVSYFLNNMLEGLETS